MSINSTEPSHAPSQITNIDTAESSDATPSSTASAHLASDIHRSGPECYIGERPLFYGDLGRLNYSRTAIILEIDAAYSALEAQIATNRHGWTHAARRLYTEGRSTKLKCRR